MKINTHPASQPEVHELAKPHPVVDESADYEKLKAEHEQLKKDLAHANSELEKASEVSKTLHEVVNQAKADSQAFITQIDREGLGMQTVTDHRKRVEKFFGLLAKVGK